MNYGLQTSVEIGGKEYAIRTDFRVILDILEQLADPELAGEEKLVMLLTGFYIDYETIGADDLETAVNECYGFIDMHDDKKKQKSPRLIDWADDFEYIIAPVNRVLGYEARAVPYDPETNTGGVHWWTFMSAYMEMGGDCLMGQIVRIRDKKARGKKLEKEEREWYRRNRHLVDFKRHYTDADRELIEKWTKGVG